MIKTNKGFYVGDISYVLADDVYFDFWGKQKGYADGEFEVNGFRFAVASTAYGDGVFYDTARLIYPVDAGVIGVVPFELVAKPEGLELGAWYDIPGEAWLKSKNGIISISLNGIITEIDTKNGDV